MAAFFHVLSRRRDAVLLGFVVLFWGMNWPIMAFALKHSSPAWIAAIRFLLGSACLFLVLAFQGRLRFPPRQDWPIVASIGLGQMMLNGLLILQALQTIPPGRSAILAYTTPIWVVPAAALLGEATSRGKALGSLVGVGGVVLLLNPFSLDWTDASVVTGHLELIAASLAWAVCILHIRRHRWVSTPLFLAPWQMLTAAIPLTAWACLTEGFVPGDFSKSFFLTSCYIGIVATAYCFWATVSVNRRLPSATMANVMLLVPIAGLISSVVVAGEEVDFSLLGGMAVILAGIVVAVRADRPKNSSGTGVASEPPDR